MVEQVISTVINKLPFTIKVFHGNIYQLKWGNYKINPTYVDINIFTNWILNDNDIPTI